MGQTSAELRFNPRARVGRDHAVRLAWQVKEVSIHAPAWGATGNGAAFAFGNFVSIHAPAWGAT